MSEDTERKSNKPLSLSGKGKLTLNKTVDAGQVRQSFPHGRSKTVAVAVKKKRSFAADSQGGGGGGGRGGARGLTAEEKEARVRALKGAVLEEQRRKAEEEARQKAEAEEAARRAEEEARQQAEAEARQQAEAEEAKRQAEEEAKRQAEAEATAAAAPPEPSPADLPPPPPPADGDRPAQRKAPAAPAAKRAKGRGSEDEAVEDEGAAKGKRKAGGGATPARPTPARGRGDDSRRRGKLTVTQAQSLDGEGGGERVRSLASVRRQRERERQRAAQARAQQAKVIRDVVIPEVITVQDLANRMAERVGDVIKSLMRMGVMATVNQSIDADTAELLVTEFGHNIKRVSESDVEMGIEGAEDRDEELTPRAPVVTIMGHVDHGKTSLLDALRATDIAAKEAGGITQHIGAYKVTMANGQEIAFLDTPGHAAFTAMRARGAKVTDVVVLVVAADDGVQPQTIEAINHAQAAEVPIIVAINKCDKPDANPDRVRNELLSHNIVVESMGGETLEVEVSAKQHLNLDKLEEGILLQAEILDLKANPNRPAQGAVVEAKLERGRGSVGTVLVERGTLRVGDVFIAGAEWGRVRALIDDKSRNLDEAGPSTPVEVLGFNGTPAAGDDFSVVENESRAREIAEFRQRKLREARSATGGRGSVEAMFNKIAAGEAKEMPVVIKGDVQGSVEAIVGSLEKLETEEVKARVLHSGVGAISESDITLAAANQSLVIGFNVRANPQARELARRDGVEIHYYSVIYDIIDDAKKMMSGLLAPQLRENFLGYAEIRQVFNISKVGKVGGCMVTEGMVKRGAKVRLLRDNVVIHEGALKTLKRFKDEVKEVKSGYECGMAFENYHDIQEGDVIECYEMEEVAREL